MTDRKHSHYYRECPYENIDVYRIIDIFEITCPAAQHILKKVIATGKRGHKDLQRDWEDIVDSAKRKIEMLEEDARVASLLAFNASPEELGDNAVEAVKEDLWFPNTPDLNWVEIEAGWRPHLLDTQMVEVLYNFERNLKTWYSDPAPVEYWWDNSERGAGSRCLRFGGELNELESNNLLRC